MNNSQIIYFVRAFKSGGVESLIKLLILHSNPEKIFIVITGSHVSKFNIEFLESKNIRYVILKSDKFLRLIFNLKFLRYICNFRPAVFWYEEISIFAILRYAIGRKTIIHVGTSIGLSYKSNLFNKILRFIDSCNISRVVCCSKLVKDQRKLFNAEVIFNAVNLKFETDKTSINENDPFRLLFVGRWEEVKNTRKIIDFMKCAPDSYHCDVFGISPADICINNFTFNGESVQPFNNNCSSLIFFPSSIEGFGLVLIEALLSSKKIITWNQHISAEILLPSDAVLFIDPDKPDFDVVNLFLLKKIDELEFLNAINPKILEQSIFLDCYLFAS